MKRRSVWLSVSVVCPVILLGMAPLAVPAQAQTRAYVPNESSNSVSVIDTASNTVVATVAVGNYPTAVAITPDGTRAYVTNISFASVSVIDTASNTVVATVGVGAAPQGVAITPDGTRAYVTDSGQFPSPSQVVNSVSVIDTNPLDASYNTVVATVGVGAVPAAVAITPDGTRAYVANYGDDNVSVIDTASNTVVNTVGTGANPSWVAITPDGTRAYVTNAYSNSVSVIDTASNTVVTVGVGDLPYGEAITPDGTRAYGPNRGSNYVSVIDTNPSDALYNTVVATVGVGDLPTAVAITSDGTLAYVTNALSNSVSVIDTNPSDASYNVVIATVGVGVFPGAVAITPFPTTSLSMGPQAMEGNLKLSPGAMLQAGYDFTMPGSHPAATVSFSGSKVTFAWTCVSGSGSGVLVVPMAGQSYTDAQGSPNWYPSGDQHSSLVYQGSIAVPDVCSGGAVNFAQGGTFSTGISSTDTKDKVNVRWHYSGGGSAGGWSGTKSVVP